MQVRGWALSILCLIGCHDRGSPTLLEGTIEQLPSHVVAEPDRVTLFADFDHAGNGHVSLYVVNRTGRTFGLATQFGKPFFKLEARNESGEWERAEGHLYAGPSLVTAKYYPVQIPAGTFRVFEGAFPERGERRRVRFREYKYRPESGLVSNTADGRVSLAEIQRVKGDRMAAHFGSEDELLAIVDGDVEPVNDHGDVRIVAIANLREFKTRRVARSLIRMLDEQDAGIVREAADALGDFESLASPAYARLLELTESPNAAIRRAAVRAAGKLRIAGLFEYLLPRLKDKDPMVRGQAARAFARLGNRAAIPHLERLLEDPDRSVRSKAETAIEALRKH